MQMIYQKENARVKEFDKLLENEKCRTRQVEDEKEEILRKGAEREQLLK